MDASGMLKTSVLFFFREGTYRTLQVDQWGWRPEDKNPYRYGQE